MGLEQALVHRHIWKRIFFEKLTEPVHINLMALAVWIFGGFRARVLFDLIIREYHAFGMLKAADLAKLCGVQEITVVEFGVATGTGLINMARIAEKVTKTTGVKIHLVGFDTGQGMPPPVDFRDHPNLYKHGDFPMDFAPLKAILPKDVDLQIGNITQTLPAWLSRQSAQRPLGYVVMDLDYYSSTSEALSIFTQAADRYLPFVPMYFDDITFDEHNDSCGELLAIREFNASQPKRVIQRPSFLANRRVYKNAPWLKQMFYCHVLDHPYRLQSPETGPNRIRNPYL